MAGLNLSTTTTIPTREFRKIMSNKTSLGVESLVHQCYHYIAMNLEKFPVCNLSQLPLKIREELLWRLPIADMCLLEDTEYVEGFQDIAAYWKHPCEELRGIETRDIDMICNEMKLDKPNYAKAVLYSHVATTLIGCLFEDLTFVLPFKDSLDPYDKSTLIPLLYAVRKPLSSDKFGRGCGLLFPARYYSKSILTSKKDIINAVIDCFKGELPKILADICVCEAIDNEYYELLTNVVCLSICGDLCEQHSFHFIKQVVQRCTCLEMVFLEDDFHSPDSANELVTFLSTQVSFLSRFRLLTIRTHGEPHIVSQENLNKLIIAYFSAPTTHLQKIVIIYTRIESYDGDVCPAIDQHYLQFKTIEFEDCYFVLEQESTHRAITQWLGQEISTLQVENSTDSRKNHWIFKIKEQTPSLLGRKRKNSEVDNEER